MRTYLDVSEPYAALRLSARNRKRIAAAVAAKPKEAAQPVPPVAPVAKAAAPKPSAYTAHAERAARPFVAMAQGSDPKPAATETAEPAKSDDNYGWAKIIAKINRRK